MTQVNLAKILSIILGPQVWLPTLLIILLLRANLSFNQLIILAPVLLFFQFLIPLAYLYVAKRLGKEVAWDLPRRKDRFLFLGVCILSYQIALIVIYFYGNSFLFNFSLIPLFLLLILSAITLFWKISLHSSLNTTGAILLNFLFGWNLPWLYLTIPIIFWARIKLKRHTFIQLLAGVIVSGVLILGSLYLLNLLA